MKELKESEFVLAIKDCFIESIDRSNDKAYLLKVISDALIYNIDDKLTTKQYHYIKGYADCKIKQLGKN